MSRIRTLAGLTVASALAIAACNNGGVAGAAGSPGGSTATEASSSPAASAATMINIRFQDIGGSGMTGGGILNDLGTGETALTLGVVAPGQTEPMPALLFVGSCASPPQASPGASPAASSSPTASGVASGSPAAS